MTRTTPKEEIQKRIDDVHGLNVIIMSDYKSAAKKAKFHCLKCDYEWETTPRSIYYLKSGCPSCANNKPLNINNLLEYIDNNGLSLEYRVDNHNQDIGRHKKIEIFHELCGNIYEVELGSFFNGRRCACNVSERISDALSMNKEDMIEKLSMSGNRNMTYESGFVSVDEYCDFRCEKGHVFKALPRQLYSEVRGCTKCHTSKGEIAIEKYLNKKGYEFIPQFKFEDLVDSKALSFDFFIPSKNVLIEFQGQQHYFSNDLFGESSFQKTQKHDAMKQDYTTDNGYELICIPFLKTNSQPKIDDYVENYLDSIIS